MKVTSLEFWADSFHEGFWACEELSRIFKLKSITYEKGFIPVFEFIVDQANVLKVTVLGSYKNWKPLPGPITYLIDWGKPDLIVYDPVANKILFAVEETAAVPTGNQALQRCERIYGSLRASIPFWYLLGEYGMHIDGGIRRDSIWPTVLAIKLSTIHRTPCVVLHYSDIEHPEDYSFGDGVKSLYNALATEIEIHIGIKTKEDLFPILTQQYQHMLDFIDTQWQKIVNYMPQNDLLNDSETAVKIAKLVTADKILDNKLLDFFNWKETSTLPEEVYNNITPCGFIKKDIFVLELERLVKEKKGYNLSNNAGSKPQNKPNVQAWISQQKKLFSANQAKNVKFTLSVSNFPTSVSGRYHVTTAKNVIYLFDSGADVVASLKKTFPRLSKANLVLDQPVFVYISNSLKPGRIFGDPFTGQLSAFSNIFTKDVIGQKTRISVAYYPHQVHTQLFDNSMEFRKNKGITMMRELLDYAVFHGGVVVNMKTGKII